ncbi:MAG: enoyl-CoA hydratase/isomerase family protein [Planctomycetota bacterium]|nr:MAG: enoyl-CoA hydratase/isomerase family protein [Planctomycetota bacterium]
MIDVKVNPPSGTLVLNRPERCNALSREMIQGLIRGLDDLHQQKNVRGVIVTGSGSHFCTGLDVHQLKETGEQPDADRQQQWLEDIELVHELLLKMLQFPKPLIAAVDGMASGSGLALMLACDLVVASHRATVELPAARLGVVSGLAIPLLTFRAGASTAARIVLGGDRITASEAKSLGMVHHVVEADQIWVRSQHWVEEIAGGAAEALQLSKRLLNETVGESLQTWLSVAAAAAATSLTTEAASEGLQAFTEKRQPKFP